MSRFWLAACLLAVILPGSTSRAGSISIAWDPVPEPDVVGYRLFIGSAPGAGDLGIVDLPLVTAVTVRSLPDCTDVHLGVKAVDLGGLESLGFASTIQGMPQPRVTEVQPAAVDQGETGSPIQVLGANFTPWVSRESLQFDDPDIRVLDLNFVSCTELEATVSVGPYLSAPGDPDYNGAGDSVEQVPPAEIGSRQVTVLAGDGSGQYILGEPAQTLDVEFVPARADIDGSGRVDGFDLALLARGFGATSGVSPAYEGRLDLNGDKALDGIDLAVLAELFALAF